MTTPMHTEMLKLADKAAAYISRLNGESATFEIAGATHTAEIEYSAEIGEDAGDRGTAPSWWMKGERVRVVAVYDNEEGEDAAEAAEWLEKQLN